MPERSVRALNWLRAIEGQVVRCSRGHAWVKVEWDRIDQLGPLYIRLIAAQAACFSARGEGVVRSNMRLRRRGRRVSLLAGAGCAADCPVRQACRATRKGGGFPHAV